MNFEIIGNTAFPTVDIHLNQGEAVRIQNGAMMYHNGRIKLNGKMNSNGRGGLGGALRALGRAATSGESFFITEAIGTEDGAELAIAPSTPGSIKELTVGQTQWRLNTGAYLASDTTVTYDMKRQNLSGAFFGGTGGLFVMETAGAGTVLINSYGDIREIHLDGRTPFVVDNTHVLAWTSDLDYAIQVASGTFGFTTGEGLVNEFHGSGTILVQTRNLESLASELSPFIQVSKN